MQLLNSEMKFESNTEYIASDRVIDVYLENTFSCSNKEVLASTRTHAESFPVGFLLENIENTVLDFNNATVVFHGRIVPFILINCKNVVIKNLKIDYDRPFYTQADVLAVEDNKMEIKICDGFDYEIKDGFLYAKSETWEQKLNKNNCLLWLYDKSHTKKYPITLGLFGDEIFPSDNPPLPIMQFKIEENNGKQIISGDFPKEWEYNDGNNVLLITHEVRNKNTITLIGGNDITIENCIIIHGAAMGVVGMHTNNITISNLSMYRDYEGNGRMVTNNADAIHCFNCYGKIVIKDCHMEGLLDDAVNIHGNYFSVKEINGNVLTMYSHSVEYTANSVWFCAGNDISVYKGKTIEKITDLKITDIKIDEKSKVQYFTVEGDTSAISPDDTVENISAQPEVYIGNCTFGEFRGTMRLQSRNKTVIKDCVFANKETSLLFTGDTTYWYEAGPVRDFLIKNCTFKNSGPSPRIDIFTEIEFTENNNYYHGNMIIENCIFEDCSNIAALRHAENVVFRNNRYEKGSYITEEACKNISADTIIKSIE